MVAADKLFYIIYYCVKRRFALKPFITKYNRTIITAVIFLLVALVVFFVNSGLFNKQTKDTSGVSYAVAFVNKVTHKDVSDNANGVKGLLSGSIQAETHILTGCYAGNTVQASEILTTDMQIVPQAGQFVVLTIDSTPGRAATVLIDDAFRLPVWAAAGAGFIVLLWMVGRRKGGRSLAALVFNLACVLGIFIPLVFLGYDPLLCAIIIQIAVAAVTFWLIDGFCAKNVAAFAGTMVSMLVAYGIAATCGQLASLNGFGLANTDSLVIIAASTQMQMSHLLLVGVVLAAFGGIMDIAMSIASAIEELYRHKPSLPAKELSSAGMHIGRDMMGTMVNTLLLAYVGASICTLLLLYSFMMPVEPPAYGSVLETFKQTNTVPLWTLLNNNLVGSELLEGITGAVAIVFTVPVISFICARIVPLRSKKNIKKAALS